MIQSIRHITRMKALLPPKTLEEQKDHHTKYETVKTTQGHKYYLT